MKTAAVVSLVACIGFVVSCTAPGSATAPEARIPVQVRAIGTGDVEDVIVATGSLRASESATLIVESSGVLTISSLPSGRRIQEGDRVESGQVLAEISGEEVRIAARVEATKRRLETSQRELDARRKLYEEGLISAMEVEQLEATVAEARAEFERSQLTETRTRITSPIAGVLMRLARDEQGLPLASGQRVVQGTVIAQVAPIANLIADIDIVGQDAPRVRVGMPVVVRHYAWKDRTFTGRLARLAPSFDPVTRSFRAEVRISNRERLLRPGMFVEASIIVESRDGVTVVPRESIAERGGVSVVFVLKGQNVAERQVRLGLGDDQTVEIVSGVEPGERVVVRGLETLADGTPVRASGL